MITNWLIFAFEERMMGMCQIIHDFTIIWRAIKTVIVCKHDEHKALTF